MIINLKIDPPELNIEIVPGSEMRENGTGALHCLASGGLPADQALFNFLHAIYFCKFTLIF